MKKAIKFYSVNDAYGEFSNFALFPIKIGGKYWPTSEHYFQAMKFESKKDQKLVRCSNNPFEAARIGRSRKKKIKKNWDYIKNNVMKEALLCKFTQHDDLKQLLITTEDSILIEHTDSDNYWGDGGNGKGKNMLGKLLMEVREKIK